MLNKTTALHTASILTTFSIGLGGLAWGTGKNTWMAASLMGGVAASVVGIMASTSGVQYASAISLGIWSVALMGWNSKHSILRAVSQVMGIVMTAVGAYGVGEEMYEVAVGNKKVGRGHVWETMEMVNAISGSVLVGAFIVHEIYTSGIQWSRTIFFYAWPFRDSPVSDTILRAGNTVFSDIPPLPPPPSPALCEFLEFS